jgi:hypothetical protein
MTMDGTVRPLTERAFVEGLSAYVAAYLDDHDDAGAALDPMSTVMAYVLARAITASPDLPQPMLPHMVDGFLQVFCDQLCALTRQLLHEQTTNRG